MDEFKDLRRKMQLPPSPSVRLEVGWGLITSDFGTGFLLNPISGVSIVGHRPGQCFVAQAATWPMKKR